MRLWFDKTGFPLLALPGFGFRAHLLPVTKLQLERFLADTNEFSDSWYDELLLLNERMSHRRFADQTREQLFATGLFPHEITQFAAWLGLEFRLPTVEEWRALYTVLDRLEFNPAQLQPIIDACPRAKPKAILTQLATCGFRTWAEFTLMRGGLVEWVTNGQKFVGLGCPRTSFQPNLWDPMLDTIIPLSLTERIHFFGFRLVSDIQPDEPAEQ